MAVFTQFEQQRKKFFFDPADGHGGSRKRRSGACTDPFVLVCKKCSQYPGEHGAGHRAPGSGYIRGPHETKIPSKKVFRKMSLIGLQAILRRLQSDRCPSGPCPAPGSRCSPAAVPAGCPPRHCSHSGSGARSRYRYPGGSGVVSRFPSAGLGAVILPPGMDKFSPPGWHIVVLSDAVQLPLVAVMLPSRGGWQNVMLPAVILSCPCQVMFSYAVVFASPGPVMAAVMFPKFLVRGTVGCCHIPRILI